MTKLDELRTMIGNLFDQVTDKGTIEQVGAVKSKLDEIQSEQDSKQNDYDSLLKDYKDVVIHQSFKPENKSGTAPAEAFDANKAFAEAFKLNK